MAGPVPRLSDAEFLGGAPTSGRRMTDDEFMGGGTAARPSSIPPLLRRPPPRATALKRAAVNAEAAFYGADGDSAGLASEAVIDLASGADRKRGARTNRGFGDLLSTVGIDALSRKLFDASPTQYLNNVAARQEVEARNKSAAFEREQARRRQAVVNLGPARTFGEKAADVSGRVSAGVTQPENFIGGPVLKGATLPVKFLRGGSAAAAANLATEPVLQASAKMRGTRDELSARDAAVNTGVAFLTGGAFGAGAHVIEKFRGRRGAGSASAAEPPARPLSDDEFLGPGAQSSDGAMAPPAFPPVPPSDGGGLRAELRGLYAGNTVDQTLGDLVSPDDVVPLRGPRPRLPDNRVSSLAEAERANPSSIEPLAIPDEREAFQTRRLASRDDPTRAQYRRGPMDLVSALRRAGGLREYGGELSHLGINNRPRNLDFARDEQFLGNLVDTERGMDMDEAAQWAWEQGYFPDLPERPDIETFMEALATTHRGDRRTFHPADWDALSDYRSRLGDRMRLEQAAREGAPAAVVRGEPIGPDDLDARALPPGAYAADVPPSPETAGNFRLDLIDSPESIDRAIRSVQGALQRRNPELGRVQSWEETQALAREMGMTADDLLSRRKGQGFTAAEAKAARDLHAKAMQEAVKLARAAVGGSDEDLAAFRAALARAAAVQERVSLMRAEAGRLLNSMKITADSRQARRQALIEGAVVGGGGRDRIEDIARKLVQLPPEAQPKFAREAVKPRWWDRINELWINSLLSGPQTHVVNAASNTLVSLWTLPEKALAAGIGGVTRSADRIAFREVGARAVGMMQGARDGLTLAKQAFLTGEPVDAAAKVEANYYRAIPGKVGEVVRIPSRLLLTADEFFKAVARQGEVNAAAYRTALSEGKNAAERAARYAELRDNPSDAIMDEADKWARYVTFQSTLGPGGRGIMQFANNVPGAKLIVPFVRTPINILKFAGERSVLAPGLKEFREAFKAGGRARDEALARVTMGSGLSALAVSYALDGRLSGAGPSDPRDRAALQDTGWQPYSIKFGDRWYSFQRFEPLSLLMGVAADFAELGEFMAPEERDKLATNIAIAIGKNITSKTWLSGASDFFEAMSDPERYGETFVSRLASSAAVPALSAQAARATDPYMREARSTLDAIKARIPGRSQTLPARLNMWGEPISRGDALGPNLISPIWSQGVKRDPVASEVVRLKLQMSKPDRKIGGAELTPQQYAEFTALSGRPAKQAISAVMGSPQWRALPDPLKRRVMRETVERFREQARYQMLLNHPDLLQASAADRMRRRLEGQ